MIPSKSKCRKNKGESSSKDKVFRHWKSVLTIFNEPLSLIEDTLTYKIVSKSEIKKKEKKS